MYAGSHAEYHDASINVYTGALLDNTITVTHVVTEHDVDSSVSYMSLASLAVIFRFDV